MEDLLIDPPRDESAERAVLGAMIEDPETIPYVLEHLTRDDFFIEEHRRLFDVLCKLWEERGPAWDDIALKHYLQKEGLSERIDLSYLEKLLEEATHGPLLESAIHVVKEKAGLRKILEMTMEVLRGVKENRDFPDLIDYITQKSIELSQQYAKGDVRHIWSVVQEVVQIIERFSREERLITGLPSGFTDLDRLTTGFHPSDLVIVAARPGMGKSSFMLSMAINMALEEKVPSVIFSLEMSAHQLCMRALSMLSDVPLQKIRTGFLSEEELKRIYDAAETLSKCEIYIDDSPSLSTIDVRIKARKLKKEKGVKAVFVDYLQLLKPPSRKSSRQEEVAEISRSLKALAKELTIPVIALAQLSRQVEHRSDKRPQLADLRESGQIEQDADVIIFIHRPEYYKKNPPPEEQGIAELIVAKQRQGPTGIVKVAFLKETAKFKSLKFPTETMPYKEEEEIEKEDIEELDIDF
ncbi:replicative DNA helicase [Thermocrinis minervae]|uniref:Replicative DNA helicase n=1 Tax=Thermocrinis minervae TaxID=381751 RepID=A0A1M6SET7_9AQUI|nr:replicative DNA helicase [Thermocrinis minervae]SHK43220.1 replicative DNA helicase [Thermocrinis minervae]